MISVSYFPLDLCLHIRARYRFLETTRGIYSYISNQQICD